MTLVNLLWQVERNETASLEGKKMQTFRPIKDTSNGMSCHSAAPLVTVKAPKFNIFSGKNVQRGKSHLIKGCLK